jgi:hypothetical protein
MKNAVAIPVKRNAGTYNSEGRNSYLTNSDYDFELFKSRVDETINYLKKVIENNNKLL